MGTASGPDRKHGLPGRTSRLDAIKRIPDLGRQASTNSSQPSGQQFELLHGSSCLGFVARFAAVVELVRITGALVGRLSRPSDGRIVAHPFQQYEERSFAGGHGRHGSRQSRQQWLSFHHQRLSRLYQYDGILLDCTGRAHRRSRGRPAFRLGARQRCRFHRRRAEKAQQAQSQ